MSKTPRPGTLAHAVLAHQVIARETKAWALPTLTAVSIDMYGATIQFDDDTTAKTVAAMYGFDDSPVPAEVIADYTQTLRIVHIDGIRIRIVACWETA